MSTISRFFACVVFVAAGGWVVLSIIPTPAGGWGWPDAADFSALLQEARRADELRRRERILLDRVAFRCAVIAEVSLGRMSLGAAAEQFRRLAHDRPAGTNAPPSTETSQVIWCTEVIHFTHLALAGDPERQARVTARLKAELAAIESGVPSTREVSTSDR